MRLGFALVLLFAGCGGGTHVVVELSLAAGTDAPAQLLTDVFGPHGRLVGHTKSSPKFPSRLRLDIGSAHDDEELRVVVRDADATMGASLAVTPQRGKEVTVHLELSSPLPDRDADDIPDAVDNCPDTANPGQESSPGGAPGDACRSDANLPVTMDLGDLPPPATDLADMAKDMPGPVDMSNASPCAALTPAPYFCEDFENLVVSGNTLRTTPGNTIRWALDPDNGNFQNPSVPPPPTYFIDDTVTRTPGGRSLKVVMNAGAVSYSGNSAPFGAFVPAIAPPTAAKFHVRAWVRMNSGYTQIKAFFPAPIEGEAAYGYFMHIVPERRGNVVANEKVSLGAVGTNRAAINDRFWAPPAMYDEYVSTAATLAWVDSWTCAEWSIDLKTDNSAVLGVGLGTSGTPTTVLTTTVARANTADLGVAVTAGILFGPFYGVPAGALSNNITYWFDDIVIDTKPIGCN